MDENICGHVRNLKKNLEAAGIDPVIREQILEGWEKVNKKSGWPARVNFMRRAVEQMDNLLSEDVRSKIRQESACCTTGSRLILIKKLYKENPDLNDFAQAMTKSGIFGQMVEYKNNEFHVTFGGDKCVCLPKHSKELFSMTFCECCAGHVRKLMESALKKPLRAKAVTSACSGGDTCRFAIRFAPEE
jgi:hypothetical protein